MYDEVMQLIALAKNDEQYFKRIDELKKKNNRNPQNIPKSPTEFVAETKAVAEKNKGIQKELKEKLDALKEKEKALDILEKNKLTVIEEHHKLSVARQEEQDAARKVKNEFETKLRKMREIAVT